MEYLTKEEIISINKSLPEEGFICISTSTPRIEHSVLYPAALDAAIVGPSRTFDGKEAYPTFEGKLYALVQPLAADHPFLDGNKRTAILAGLEFLRRNGRGVNNGEAFGELVTLLVTTREEAAIEYEEFEKQVKPLLVEAGDD